MEPIASLTLICDLMPSSLRIRRVTIPSTAISKTLLPLTAADACFVDRSAALSTPEQQAHIRQQAAQAEPTLVLCLSIIQGLDLAGSVDLEPLVSMKVLRMHMVVMVGSGLVLAGHRWSRC